MKRMEVRCCCKPQKLLGWLPVPASAALGETLHFTIPPVVRFLGTPLEPQGFTEEGRRVISLPVEMFGGVIRPGVFGEHLALKSEETPLETLRQIPGFVEKGREL